MTPSPTSLDDLVDQLLFAFYGRVSTEDQQDPQASYDWQISRARQLIEPKGGVIVAEFFDIGHSRALPWPRRPRASELLALLRDPGCGFQAVVIGEPQRAFYGNQFSLTFPVFEHFGVGLWVPEVGGPIDPDSEAHDLAMTLFGSQSKSERMRVKTRVRAAMAAQTAIQGRYLGGRPPYGYRLADAGPHPNPAKARLGARLHKLDPDPATAPVVKRIFALFLQGYGYLAIAELLTGEAIPSPSGYDPDRNPHRDGRAWSKSAVRAILTNPRYTGYQVWNRQRRDEILLDVDDVAAGYTSRMTRNDPDGWIWSEQPAHQPLIPKETFDATQAQIRSRGWRDKPHRPRELATARIYLLRRRLRCGLCKQRMEAHWIHKQPYYRCTLPSEYATAKHPDLDHPRTVYLREAELLPHLDGWITALFDPANLDHTLEALVGAAEDDSAIVKELREIDRTLADCQRKLAHYRAALDAGSDPTTVTAWINQTTAEQAIAQAKRAQLRAVRPMTVTKDQLRAIVTQTGDMVRGLDNARPADRAELYERLGIEGLYQPRERLVVVSADVVSEWCASHLRHEPHRDWIDFGRDRVSPPAIIVPVPWQHLGVPRGRADGPSGIWSTPAPHHLRLLASLQPAPRPISAVVSSDAQVLDAVTPHHPHPVVPGSRQLTTSLAARCPVIASAEAARRCAQRPSRKCGSRDAEPMHLALQPYGTHPQLGEHAPQRPGLLDPPHPQIPLHTGEPQASQAGLPFGRPAFRLPLDGPVGPDGRPLAGQPVLVEPVPHGGLLDAELAGDHGARPSPDHRSVGKVCPQRGKAQPRGAGRQVLVGATAASAGRGHLAGWGG